MKINSITRAELERAKNKMKTSDLIYERIKVQPVTNADLNKAQEEYERNKNPFRLLAADIVGDIKGFPMGVVVRMMEEQEKCGNKPDVTVFQKYNGSSRDVGGFYWQRTEAGKKFWSDVIGGYDFELFYEKYPEYKKYDE